jgi:hypothetical protein
MGSPDELDGVTRDTTIETADVEGFLSQGADNFATESTVRGELIPWKYYVVDDFHKKVAYEA